MCSRGLTDQIKENSLPNVTTQAVLLNSTGTTGLLQNLVSSRHGNVIAHVFIRLHRSGITEAVVAVHI